VELIAAILDQVKLYRYGMAWYGMKTAAALNVSALRLNHLIKFQREEGQFGGS
jgi:hypothetical protein